MTNIRFNLPEDVIADLDHYVHDTMPEGYGTTMTNLIRYAEYHLSSSDRYEIILDHPSRIFFPAEGDDLLAGLAGAAGTLTKPEGADHSVEDSPRFIDADAVRASALKTFAGSDDEAEQADFFYEPSGDDMAILRVRYREARCVQDVIRRVPSVMLPYPAIEEDGSITLMYLPTAKDRGSDIYDIIDRVEAAMDR